MKKIGIIGGGNMGEAIIASSLKKFSICVNEKDKKRCAYLKSRYKTKTMDLTAIAKSSDIIILAVKPQDIEEVLNVLKGRITKNQLVISIAAGITTRFIEKILKENVRIVRTMPNMPALIGQGITAVAKGKYASSNDLIVARRIFDHVGQTIIVQEKLIDGITAVSGSGPAYVYYFMECLINAAKSLGFSESMAKQLVKATFLGSINLAQQKNLDPEVLRAKVTSKGGTTAAALNVFTKKKFETIVKAALTAAKKRAVQLSKG
ncbi:MAG: pyrroline-5-carboxylate reductase [Candidatus Omnitrophota bacterium]